MTHPRRRRDVQARACLGVLFLVLGFGNMVVTAGADTPGAPVTVVAAVARTAQLDGSPSTPLTGLQDGDQVVITVTGNPTIFGFEARICKPNAEIEQQSDFSPTSGGNCAGAPFAGGEEDDQFKSDSAAPDGNVFATTMFRVGVGSQPDAAGLGTTITCGPGSPCALWLKLSLPATFNGGTAFVHIDLLYGEDEPVPTTTSTSTTSTSTIPGANPTSTSTSSTSTTAPGAPTTTVSGDATTTTSTSTTAGTGTTTTVPGPLSASPSSVAAGETLNVTTTGWKAETTVMAVLNSDPVELGTFAVDTTGKGTKALTVPASVPAGSHTLKVTGTGADGAARELTTPITVTTKTVPLARTGAASVWHLLWNSTALLAAGLLLMVAAIRRGRPAL